MVGSRLQDCERILDFGCGCGRVLLWLKDLAGTTALYGSDIDATAIEWAREHLPYVTFTRQQPDCPRPEFPDAFFDFVYCQSVFTHIDETYQDAWLAELQRIVKPGGRLLLSVNGEQSFQQLEKTRQSQGLPSSALRAARDMKGLLFITETISGRRAVSGLLPQHISHARVRVRSLEPLLQDSRVHPAGFAGVSGLRAAGTNGAG